MRERISPVTETFLELVQIDSPTGYEGEMAQGVKARLEAIGLDVEIDKEGNVLTKLNGNPSLEPYLLNAHLDTVEPGRGIKPYIDHRGWIRSEGETILGADNKTAVAAILETLKRLVEEGSENHHPLEVVFTVSEESGNHGAHGLDYSKLTANKGYIFDASDREFGDVIISSPFYNRFDVKIRGKPAHASKPENAVNVIPIFVSAASQIKLGRISERTLVNIGIIDCGQVVNTVPGEMMVSGEVRSRDEEELEYTSSNIRQVFEKASLGRGASAEVKITRENGGFEFSKDDEFLKRTLTILRQLGIKDPDLIESWGCYEANIFAEHRIMMLNIADGSIDTHTPEERIRVSNLVRLTDLVYALVTKE